MRKPLYKNRKIVMISRNKSTMIIHFEKTKMLKYVITQINTLVK